MTWILWIALAQAGAVVVPSSAELQVAEDGAELVEEAYAALAAGDLVQAATLFDGLAEGGAGEPARVLQAMCLYEIGLLRHAEQALDGATSGEALNLRGLIRRERGDATGARADLERARKSGNEAVVARARLNLASMELDAGRVAAASKVFEQVAASSEDPAVQAEASDLLGRAAGAREEAGGQGLDAVGAALRRGALASAEQELDRMRQLADTPRKRIEVGLAEGAVFRASGRPDAAAESLMSTLEEARVSGLAWETGQALFSLGIAHSLAGREDLALTFLAESEATHRSAGFDAEAVQVGIELGRPALRLGRLEVAQERLASATRDLGGMDRGPAHAARDELHGGVLAEQGKLDEAVVAYEKALSYREAQGHYAEAARVATAMVRATGVAGGTTWIPRAEALFQQSKDTLGPAHVQLAWGLARVEAEDLEGALTAFGTAAELARATGRGELVAATAERNAAQALVLLGASEDAARLASEGGVSSALAHQQGLELALSDYETGLAHYAKSDYGEARKSFRASADVLAELGETAYAERAEVALAWSNYNIAVGLPLEKSWPFWSELIAEAHRLDDAELLARTTAASALAAAKLGQGSTTRKLTEAGELAQKTGLPDVAARCWAALVEQPGELHDRARLARRAYALAPSDPQTVYAMYSVAVDAYNADDVELARDLALEVRDDAGELAEALDSILEATR
ncbi:MAG: tetratricopeptide repeat protein [Proteobacteria bacterium]|nr:tetratricopeptide repeat protein [Pseudomonadota bacterium]